MLNDSVLAGVGDIGAGGMWQAKGRPRRVRTCSADVCGDVMGMCLGTAHFATQLGDDG